VRSSRGFTLVELMIVVLIIGILAVLFVPNMFKMSLRAKVASVKRNMHVVQITAEDFACRNDGNYPANAAAVTADGGLRFDQVLPNGRMPDNPFLAVPTVLDWSNAAGTPPATDPQGGIALNVMSSGGAGTWDTYEVLGEDDTGQLLTLILRND